ncbi:MAG: ferredoxin family protein [Firmicutes bacterium]|nr:ferredoxin family protein [Bacillota bacterium]
MATKEKVRIDINLDWCKGCGICIAFCPTKVFDVSADNKPLVARPEDCIQCMLCEIRCPDLAINVGGGTDGEK